MATITHLESLAGVRIPDTPLAKAAVDLLEACSDLCFRKIHRQKHRPLEENSLLQGR